MVGHTLGQPPVEHLTRARVVPVDQEVVGAELVEAGNGAFAGPEGLDHRRHPLAHPGGLLGRLVAVQLRRVQTGHVNGLGHPLGCFVPEDPDRQDVLGESLGDVPGQLHRHLPGRRGEDETERGRAQAHCEQGVGLGGDAADLDEEVVAHRAPTGCPISLRSSDARSPARTKVSPTRMAS